MMAGPRNPWHLDDAAAESAARRRRAEAWRRHDRAIRTRRRLRRWLVPYLLVLLLAVAAGAVAARLGHGPWPTDLALRHEMARAGCAAARAVGLAPARIGEPGYWPHLDADHDGIACEPWWPPGDRWAREDRGPAWRP